MSFLEFYNIIQETREDFYVGKILVHLVEVSEAEYLAEAASPNALNSKVMPLADATPEGTKKWRATYTINGRQVTNYLTAQNKLEAKRVLFDYLYDLGKDDDRKEIVRSSELFPVDNWNELVRLLQYSMRYDRRKKGGDTEPFGSIDTADFHLMLDLVRKNPKFVEKHLAALPQDLQFYFKKAYNALSRRDLDKDLAKGSETSYWGGRVKNLVGEFGNNIKKQLASVKTRNSPNRPSEPVSPNPEPIPQDVQTTLGLRDKEDYTPTRRGAIIPGIPQPGMTDPAPQYQSRFPFWRSM